MPIFPTLGSTDNKILPDCSEKHTDSLGVPGSSRTFSYAKAGSNSSRGQPSPHFPRQEGDPLAPDHSNPRTHEAPLGLVWRRELAAVMGDSCPLLFLFFPFRRAPFAHRGTKQGSAEAGGHHFQPRVPAHDAEDSRGKMRPIWRSKQRFYLQNW